MRKGRRKKRKKKLRRRKRRKRRKEKKERNLKKRQLMERLQMIITLRMRQEIMLLWRTKGNLRLKVNSLSPLVKPLQKTKNQMETLKK